MNSFELSNEEPQTLLDRIASTLATCPLLGGIYDDAFQRTLVSKKEDLDNYLLWMVASNDPIANALVKDVESCLNTLKPFGVIGKFERKLRQYETGKVKSVLVELHLPRKFAEKGENIQFEPPNPGKTKGPDFKASNSTDVYFEITVVYEEEIRRLNRVKMELRKRLRRVPEPFVFSLTIPSNLQLGEVPQVCRNIRLILQNLQAAEASGFRKEIPAGETPVKLRVVQALQNEYGHLGSTLTSTQSQSTPADLSSKISKKTEQLPKNEAGVLVIDPSELPLGFDVLKDALYGEDVLQFSRQSGQLIGVARGAKRFFLDERNTRVSAVYYYHWIATMSGLVTNEAIFHNPFASRPIPSDYFKPLRQFLPYSNGSGNIEMRWSE